MKPDDGYIAYIVNPKAGAGSQRTISRQFKKYLLDKGFRVNAMLTASLEDAFEFAKSAAQSADCALVVASGGDGVVREVADGLRNTKIPMLIVPAGTENLLANELGFDEKFQTLVKTFEDGFTRALDLGSANGKCFTSIAGFGFDGLVIKRVSEIRSGHIDHFDYLWPVWRTFWDYRFDGLKVELDGEVIFDGPALVFVGNISRYALGLEILHYADFGDGLLDVCIYKCASRTHLVKHSILTVLKHHSNSRDVIYRQGKSVIVSSENPNLATEIDGDPGPALPVRIDVIRHAVNVMVPKSAKPAGVRTRLIRAIG